MKKKDIEKIFYYLNSQNNSPKTELSYSSPYTLLIAVILSAQSTDKSVNKVTSKLFKVVSSPRQMIDLGENKLKNLIKTIGLFNTKAKNIILTSQILVENFNSEVPKTRDKLESLPGVGRKTANVILNEAFGFPTIAVDTHIFRLSNRIGLSKGKNPLEVELDLEKNIPENLADIFDEIYSGWCKTGKLFYFMNYENLFPDILTSAKSLGGGKASISCYTCRDHVFKKAYDNQKDATLHSTTFNGFGEETITAIEAINIIVEEDFEKKSIQIGENISQSLYNLKKKHNNIISEVRGSGCLNGIVINTAFADKYLKPILNLIPMQFLKDDTSIKKIIVASIIYDLYQSYNILTFYGSNKDIPLKVAPSLMAKKEDIDYFENSLDQVLSKGLVKLVSNFVSQKFFSKFK